jgi:hypothetical protein
MVISRLQFTTTEGCPDTFDQIVYMQKNLIHTVHMGLEVLMATYIKAAFVWDIAPSTLIGSSQSLF